MLQYPGQDTEFFIIVDGETIGPVVGLEELSLRDISADTPVWYDGLDDWRPALLAPLTSQLFSPSSAFRRAMAQKNAMPAQTVVPPAVPPEIPKAPSPQSAWQPGVMPPQMAPVMAEPAQKPNAYLVWSIVVAVVFNIICGVIAIIYSVKVRSKFAAGNVEGAERCSVRAQWWIAVGITAGLIFTVARLFMGGYF